MDTNTYLAKLNYQPIDTLPWIDENMACDFEQPDIRRSMPLGVVLKHKHRPNVIIGNELCGCNIAPWDGPTRPWEEEIYGFTHWAWIWDVKE